MKISKTWHQTNLIVFFSSLVVLTMPLKSNFNSIAIILFVLYIYLFLYSNDAKMSFRINIEVIILILPFLFILIQGFYSEFDTFSRNLLRALPLLVFPFCFSRLKPYITFKQLQKILKVLLISALGYSLFLLVVALYRQISFSPDFSKINWYFFTYYDFTNALKIHPTYLGLYNCLAFMVVFNEFLSNNKNRFWNFCFIMILSIVIFLLGSRIALVCLFLTVIGFLVLKFRTIPKNIRAFVVLIVVLLPITVLKFVPIVKERMIDMTFGLKETFEYAKLWRKCKI